MCCGRTAELVPVKALNSILQICHIIECDGDSGQETDFLMLFPAFLLFLEDECSMREKMKSSEPCGLSSRCSSGFVPELHWLN